MLSGRVNSHVLWLVLVVSLCFNAGVGATFGVRGYRRFVGPHESPHHNGRFGFVEDLDLTADQAEQMESAKGEMTSRHRELRREIGTEHAKLAELMSSPELDHAAIDAQLAAIGGLRSAAQKQLVDHFLDIKERVLQPEQRQVFDEHIRNVFSRGGRGLKGLRGGAERSRRHGGRARTQSGDCDN